MSDVPKEQEAICEKYGALCVLAAADMKVGIAENVRQGLRPINGLRHPPQGDTCGWYIWAGDEVGGDPNFFKPLHVSHIADWCPEVQKFLGLPPGWRFLVDGDYEDVWYDESLLEI